MNKWNFTPEELLEICGDISIKKYSIYATYRLFLNNTLETIHSNQIEIIQTDNYENARIQMFFDSEKSFSFLGTGFTADKITVLIQLVENDVNDDVVTITSPRSDRWKEFDVTDQVSGGVVNAVNLRNSNFFVLIPPLSDFQDEEGTFYSLDYINYPQNVPVLNDNKLLFGEEFFFFGNIETKVEAIAHITDLPIQLPTNEFNTSTNKTWSADSSVYITEVGIYDDEDNLVAIAKPSQPIEKNSKIGRTIIFSMDF